MRGPHPLAMAIAQGKLPFIRALDLQNVPRNFLSYKPNCNLLGTAMGYLPRLTDLDIVEGDCVVAFESAFKSRSIALHRYPQRRMQENEEIEEDEEGKLSAFPHQAMMKRLKICRIFDGKAELLLDLLQLPFFGRLQELNLAVHDEYSITKPDMVPSRLRVLTAYIRHTGGAPFLRKLEINLLYTQSSRYLEPLMTVLMQGGAPGLTHLTLSNLNNKGTRFLDKIYRAGGLA